MKIDSENLNTVIVTDCGSTTTKALLFERTPERWRQTGRGEAPTTVEAPVADVTIGVVNAFRELEEISGRQILTDSREDQVPILVTGNNSALGSDIYLSTSSAGGGLQMLVAGVVHDITTESAERAALGAGAIVLDAVSADDGREEYERIERIRHIRPDIVLITGGVDGGSQDHVIEMAETLLAAAPRPRFGTTLRLPVIYAGNSEAASEVSRILQKTAQVLVVPNVRPTLEQEQLGPAREAIHEFFLSHVMSHSPGYGKLLNWSPRPILPTPAAVGRMVHSYAEQTGQQILCADIGGATTDVFSVFRNRSGEQIFNRTVSANLGMSYSVANVLIEVGEDAISRWLPFDISPSEVCDRLRNKMIRPTTIPQTLEDLALEQAVCREALSLALIHHRDLAVGLSGVQQQRGIAEIFSQQASRCELVDMKALNLVIGSGGVLSHAPDRLQSALMMLEGFQLEGVTELAVDSIFMMPHLGVLAELNSQAATEIFLNDCLIRIAHAIVPLYRFRGSSPRVLAEVYFEGNAVGEVCQGKVALVKLVSGAVGTLRVEPARGVDVGLGVGEPFERRVTLGSHGLLLDGRGRPLEFSSAKSRRIEERQAVYRTLGLSWTESRFAGASNDS